jgi:hypothetical protein
VSNLQQISSPPQASAEVVVNENFDALEHQAVYAKDATTTSALTWGYCGGRWGGTAITAGTLSLTASNTNYVVVALATGVISVSTSATNWNDGASYARVYKITTSSSAVSAVEDHRVGAQGVHGNTGASSLTVDTDGTLAANSDTRIATQKATKTYVDAKVAGLSWKTYARAATTVAGTLATSFENGDTVDGVTLATGDRILVKNQASGAENGIYTVNASGAPTRATDADSSAELVDAAVYVAEGTTNADTQWVCTTNGPITVGSTSLTFTQFQAGGSWSFAATQRVLGRNTAGAGAGEEVSLTQLLDWIGSAAQGDILYRGSSAWARLAAGTDRQMFQTRGSGANPAWAYPTQAIVIACGDEVSGLSAGTAKVTFRMPYAFKVLEVRASLTTAQTANGGGGIFTVDINEAGTTIISTKLTIDNTEKTSTTAATPPVISDADLADDAEITVDIDQIGDGTAKGLKVMLIGYKNS